MRRKLLAAVAFVALSSASFAAFAQNVDAPEPWFDGADDAVSAPAEAPRPVVVVPQPDAAVPNAGSESWGIESPSGPVVVVIVPGATVVQGAIAPPPPAVAPDCPPPVRRKVVRATSVKSTSSISNGRSWQPEVGFDFRFQRLSFGGAQYAQGASPDARMLGGGGNLRIHLNPKREFDIGNEFMIGKDFNGLDRGEGGFSLFTARHFNPDGRLRFYSLGGASIWFGSVQSDKYTPLTPKLDKQSDVFRTQYSALSLQAGLGAEVRMLQRVSFHVDVLATVRWRFSSTNDAPEYIDPVSGEGSNLYPALLLRGGLTLWPGDKK